jgi:hypothetical protein
VGGNHEDAGELKAFMETEAHAVMDQSGCGRAVGNHHVNPPIRLNGVRIDNLHVRFTSQSRANAHVQNGLCNGYEYRDWPLGFVLGHFTLLDGGK